MIRIIATIIFHFAFNMCINNVIRKNEGVFCVPLQKMGEFYEGYMFFCFCWRYDEKIESYHNSVTPIDEC